MKAHSIRFWENKRVEQTAWFLVWFSLPFSLKFNGASLILVALVILVSFFRKPFHPDKKRILYLLPLILFFAWNATELLRGHPFLPVWKELERMSSFVVIPLLMLLSRIRKKEFTQASLNGFVLGLVICSFIMLGGAMYRFSNSHDWSELTYHKLATPFHTGAIYFSFYLLLALFKLDDPVWFPNHWKLKVTIGIFFLLMLFLLASKLLIGVGVPLLIWYNRKRVIELWHHRKSIVLALIFLFALGSIPFLKRMETMIHPNLDLVNAPQFKYNSDPDGLSLRLIFWRFGKEILEEHQAWIAGVGVSQSQELLNQKFYQYKLYTGSSNGTDTGYLNYNFHNQFVETLVRTGIIGLSLLILILVIFAMQPQNELFAPKMIVWLLAAFFVTESVLERQAGIVVFCLIYVTNFYSNDFPTEQNRRS